MFKAMIDYFKRWYYSSDITNKTTDPVYNEDHVALDETDHHRIPEAESQDEPTSASKPKRQYRISAEMTETICIARNFLSLLEKFNYDKVLENYQKAVQNDYVSFEEMRNVKSQWELMGSYCKGHAECLKKIIDPCSNINPRLSGYDELDEKSTKLIEDAKNTHIELEHYFSLFMSNATVVDMTYLVNTYGPEKSSNVEQEEKVEQKE